MRARFSITQKCKYFGSFTKFLLFQVRDIFSIPKRLLKKCDKQSNALKKDIEKNSKVFKTEMLGTLKNTDWYLVTKNSMVLRICNALVKIVQVPNLNLL